MVVGLRLEHRRSGTLELFLAVQRELMGRFAQEISLLPCPVVPEIAQFVDGIRTWRRAGLNRLPAWIATAGDPGELIDRAGDHRLRQGACHIAEALTAAGPILGPMLASLQSLCDRAGAELDRLLPLEGIEAPFREALGVGPEPLALPLYLVPLAPHYPGAGFLTDGDELVSAYIECRRYNGSTLADSVLTLLGWALLRTAVGPRSLTAELGARLPGGGPYQRRLRAVLTKVLVEMTAARLVSEGVPRHRACVDVLGTAWRYPRLHAVAERHWGRYLAGLGGRDEVLDDLAQELSRLSPRWYIDHVDASSLAADFYLLEYLAAVGDVEAGQRFARWVPRLAGYFAAQIDLIIGGELGHFERARDKGTAEPLASFMRRLTDGDSRVAWWRTRTELGQSRALALAAEVFSGLGAEHGGEAWGPVAATLRRYVEHELSHTVFVDQCFTLEHNNGSLFDKYLATERLPRVLDAQAAGNLATLAEHASAEVRRMWADHQERRLAEYSATWLAAPAERPSRQRPWSGAGRFRRAVLDTPPGSLGCGSDCEPEGLEADAGSELVRPVRVRRRWTADTQAAPRHDGAVATLHTVLGVVTLELWPRLAPHTVDNFVGLALGRRRWKDPVTGADGVGGFYDGTSFHRRIPGFLIQGGDRSGSGEGGPGFRIPDEHWKDSRFDRPFLVAMVNYGPNSAGSQFFITLAPAAHLSGSYCQFGEVADPGSQEVVRMITEARDAVTLRSVTVSTW